MKARKQSRDNEHWRAWVAHTRNNANFSQKAIDMTTNYARNVDTSEIRFFDNETKMHFQGVDLERWAFFDLPRGANASTFRGRLIGESSDLRAERLGQPVVKSFGELS